VSKIDDGGPVAPNMITQKFVDANTVVEDRVKAEGGLSIRDYFAAAALQGILANPIAVPPATVVRASYEYADAMIEVRKEGA
jgi:hypothetical protein